MRYSFRCASCGETEVVQRSIKLGPPDTVKCPCKQLMQRDWYADIPMIDTSNCRDANWIPEDKRVSRGARVLTKGQAKKEERKFAKHIQDRRKLLAREGSSKDLRQTHSVPADLYHGKIRETGDRNYWDDPKNMNKHKDCKVS